MNWYRFYKSSQFVDFNGLVTSIYQRLIQADRGNPAGETAADDVNSQGYDLPTIETALQQAVYRIVGDQGEIALSPAQQHIVQSIRGGSMYSPAEGPMNGPETPTGLGQGAQLNAV